MDDMTRPEAVKKNEPRRRASRAVLVVLAVLAGLGFVIVVDTMNLGGASGLIDRIGVLPLCVHDQGDCTPCYGPSCRSLPRGTPSPCASISDFNARLDCEMNTAKPPVRVCRRVLGFMCVELQTGPE